MLPIRDRQLVLPGWVGVLVGALVGLVVGCGPISAEEKVRRPPYIAPSNVEPSEHVIQREELGDGTIVLEVTELYDPNDDEELYGIWLRGQDAFDDVRAPATNATKVVNGETFYVYEGMRVEIDPCRAIRANNLKETIWLLVSDRRFADITTPTPAEGAYVVSRSWELNYSGNIIAQCDQ